MEIYNIGVCGDPASASGVADAGWHQEGGGGCLNDPGRRCLRAIEGFRGGGSSGVGEEGVVFVFGEEAEVGVEGGGGDGDAVDDFVGAFAGVLAGVFVEVFVVVVDVGVVLFGEGFGGDEFGVLVGEEEADAL